MLLVVLIAVFSASFGSSASANEGKPVYNDAAPSDAVGEVGGIPTVTIREERLNFDFRPLAKGGVPHVTATYTLVNEGAAVRTPLVFASFDIEGAVIEFDKAAVASQPLASSDLPIAWETAVGETKSVTHGEGGASGLAFEVEIGPGTHTLGVQYDIAGQWEWTAGGTVVRYALAPARSWKALDSLHVEILCPSETTCSPLDFEGKPGAYEKGWQPNASGWSAHYTEIPTDLIKIRVCLAEPMWPSLAGYGMALLGLLVAVATVWLGGKFLAGIEGRGRRVLAWLVLAPVIQATACGYGLVWSSVTEHGQSATSGYGGLLHVLLSCAVGLVLAVGAVPIAATIMRRRRAG